MLVRFMVKHTPPTADSLSCTMLDHIDGKCVTQSTHVDRLKPTLLLSGIMAVLGLAGCSSTPQSTSTLPPTKVIYQHKSTTNQNNSELLDASSFDSLEDLLYATDVRAVEGDRLAILRYGDVWKRIAHGFKMDLAHYDERIEAQRGWFASRQTYLDRLSARASRYLYFTVKEAERRGIPTELALLPIIESSYDPAATSSAAAAGMWQFIPSTGKIYGLRQTDLYDGRRDVVESTRAAYEYLTSLYNQFGSWELALAAYNAGPGRIQQAINRNNAAGLPTDYWSLRLPTETMNYVPRFLAVAQIIKNPRQYGVQLPPIANRPHFREVQIPGAIDLDELSRLTGVSRGELYALNPGHRGNYTDPYAPPRILIPNDVSVAIDSKIARMRTVSGFGGLWTGGAAPVTPVTTSSSVGATSYANTRSPVYQASNNTAPTVNTVVRSNGTISRQIVIPSTAVPTFEDNNVAVNASPSSVSASNAQRRPTPTGSAALAQFANSATVPSAPRVPVSITPNPNITPLPVEPPLSAAEKAALASEVSGSAVSNVNSSTTSNTSTVSRPPVTTATTEPLPTDAEKQQIVRELQTISPEGTQIVDPLDGKIKLTAIQSSQSVAAQKGEEVKITYAYPKVVAQVERQNRSETVARNANKPAIETKTEVVVIPPKAQALPQGKRSSYVVRAGDNLKSIAERYGVNWRDIVQWNQIDPDKALFVGTRLYLYNAKPVALVRSDKYVVQNGDTLTALAATYDIDLQDLAEWNDLSVNSNLLRGQRLTLVAPKNVTSKVPRLTANPITPDRPSVATKSYTVKRGEHLTMLAERYGMTNTELAALTPDLTATTALQEGQRINVPKHEVVEHRASSLPSPVNTTSLNKYVKTKTYTVKVGENLSQIAHTHGMELSELAALNHLTSVSGVFSGQKLKVYAIDGEKPHTYKVQPGDTLSSIAAKFGLKTQYLASLNRLSPDAKVTRGTVLDLFESENEAKTSNLLPIDIASKEAASLDKARKEAIAARAAKDSAKQAETVSEFKGATESYVVKAGESLTALSARYGLTLAELASLNGLKVTTSLRSGQRLKVPKRTLSYKVKSGDSLIRLAKKYGMTAQQFADLNGLKATDNLQLGQTIVVPNL